VPIIRGTKYEEQNIRGAKYTGAKYSMLWNTSDMYFPGSCIDKKKRFHSIYTEKYKRCQ